jgi:DNA-binding CsgD family transcriptional regulator
MVESEESAPSARPIAHSKFPLVDRNQILQEFETIFSGSVRSHNGCLSVEGAWGMGRTALVNAACLTAESAGCIVLRTRGDKSERPAPFGALLRLIEDIASLRSANEEIVEQIHKVLDRLHHDGERHCDALGAAFYGLVLSVRKLGFVLVAVDDADMVDDATMLTLEYFFHRLDDQQIWLLTTSPPRLSGAAPLVIEELLVNQDVRHFELSALSREGVRIILSTQLNVEPERGFVDAVLEATSGRPKFVVELARACRDEHVTPDDAGASQLDRLAIAPISQSVSYRLNRLGPGARDLLESCAVYGELDDVTPVLRLADVDPDTSERAIDSLKHAELLRASHTLAFAAPIVQRAILRDIPSPRRSRLHVRCADLLERSGADQTAVVSHLLATDPAWSKDVAKRLKVAGKSLLDRGDVLLAMKCLRRSLNESARAEQDASSWLDLAECEIELDLRTALSSFQKALTLGFDDHERVIKVALVLTHSLRDWPELRGEGVATLQGLASRLNAVDTTLQLEFELGLTLLSGQPAQQNYGVARIGALVVTSDPRTSASRAARVFLDLLQFESDPKVTAEGVVEVLVAAFQSDQMPVGGFASEVILTRACRMLLNADEFARVDQILEMACWHARALGDLTGEDDALRLVVLSKLWQGWLDEADKARHRHNELGACIPLRHLVGASDLLIAHGRTEEALYRYGATELDRIVDPLDRASAHVERGRLYMALDRTNEALDECYRAKETAERAGIHNEILVAWRPLMARALASLGRWDEAKELASSHLAAARAFGARRSLGAALRAMADSTQDLDDRVNWLIESVKVLDESPARLEMAGAMIDLGVALVERHDTETARTLFQQSATIAVACRAQRLVEIANSHLRSLGSRTRQMESTGMDSLTPAELRAVSLAAVNVTNRAIADKLFVNVKTIEGHLSKAYRKLGVSSRFELAEVIRAHALEKPDPGGALRSSPAWSEDSEMRTPLT